MKTIELTDEQYDQLRLQLRCAYRAQAMFKDAGEAINGTKSHFVKSKTARDLLHDASAAFVKAADQGTHHLNAVASILGLDGIEREPSYAEQRDAESVAGTAYPDEPILDDQPSTSESALRYEGT